MQKRKSFFNNEMEQRFSLRKYTIGLCSVCLGFVVIGMGSQTVKADTVNDVEKSSAVQENKAQDTDSANTDALAESKTNTSDSVVAKSNTTPTETKENEAGSVAATAPKTADSNNSASVNTLDQSKSENTLDQSKSENSSAVAPTSEKTQLQTSQDSSIKVKENNLNTNKSDTPKTVVQPTSLNDENNLRDPDSKDVEVKPKESSNVDTNEQKETSTALPKQPANADTQLASTTSGVQPFMNLAVVSDNNDLTPKKETVDSTWTLHYVNQSDHKQELKDPTVITMQYERTNTPQSDGTTEYGNWSYVPGSFKQTGTPITVKDSNNPVKQDNVDKNGENFDVFTITAMYPTVAGYGFYNGINGTRLHDDLVNDNRQADSMSKDFYAEYDVAKPMSETVTSQWTIHYVNSADHKQELKNPTVITMQYTRTDTPQSNGKIQYGDWSYVPGSFKLTGTPITVNGSDNPVKEDNVDNNGKSEDVFSIIVKHPTITGYEFHNGINGVRLSDHLLNNESNGEIQAPTMSKDGYVEYDVAKERSVAVKFVDDQSFDPDSSDGKTQVGQAITLTGHDGDTVNLNLTVPDKYQLADGQQLPTTYTFAKGSGDLKIHLVHKVVQREAAIDVQLGLATLVRTRGDDGDDAVQMVVTQTRWKQLEDSHENLGYSNASFDASPFVEVGTLTGHVDYDLVDETVVSLKNDWTSLNLSGHSYELPNGTEVVNGIRIDASDTIGKKLRDDWYLNEYRKWHSDVDPDYITRPWHGYLSVNETNNERNSDYDIMSYVRELGLQAGLVGDEPNALAKAIGDRAATSVEMSNKPIDLNLLQDYDFDDFSEQNGQLQAKALLPLVGVYIPYVEKTATRTINVTTPEGKTTAVKQTTTLAKQVDFGKDAHPAWTTGEWASYEVPTIPGYTASQSNVAKEAVTGETKDQTVNITYTANPQTATVVYQTEDGTPVHTTTVSGRTGQTVKVSNEVPVGWHVVNGTVPSEITFAPNGTPQTVVTIAHSHVTVTPDAPKTTSDKLPDNPGKTYPAGIGESDLNKTVTRTIKVTTPDGQTKTVAQTAKLTRTADVDEVTGNVTYSDWTTDEWSVYAAPTVPGYTASQPNIADQTVTNTTKDATVTITYTANEHQISIEYVDNTTGQVVKTDHVSGKTGQTVSITPHVPDGWELVSGQSVPSEVTLGADGAPATVIKVQPQERSLAVKFVDDQSDERQVGKVITVTGRDGGTVDLHLTVPDKYQLADGQQLPTAYTFKNGSGDLTIHLVHQVVQREAAVDVQLGLVTMIDNGVVDDGALTIAVTQNHWKQLDDAIKDSKNPNSDKVFPSVKVGTLTGHVNYDLVDNKVVSFNDDWTSLNLGGHTYQMPDGTEVVNGVSTGSVYSWGKSLKEQLLKYHPDTDPDYVNRPWHGYLSVNETNEIAPDFTSDDLQAGLVGDESNALAKATGDQAATVVKMANKTIDSNWLKDNFNDFEFGEQNGQLRADGFVSVVGLYIPYVEKTATRTIKVTTPDGKTITVKQTATLAKQVDFADDAHPAWTTGEWANYDVPTIPGYTASQSQIAKTAVTGTTEDQTVNITYTANPQTVTVVYQSEDGISVHTTTVNGHTGQTVKVSNEVPVGWHVVNGTVPSEITFGPNGTPKTVVTIAHSHATVTPDAPKTTSDKLPDNPAKTYPAGVSHDDLNKTITGTIKVTMPDGQIKTVVKAAHLTRTADVDEVTGEVTYSDWTTGYWSDYTAPSVPGYTANYPYIAGQLVTGETTDQTIEITYTANDGTQTIVYQDEDGSEIDKQVISGKTDEKVKVTPDVPDGYVLKGEVPSEVTIKPDDTPITVTVEHGKSHVTPDKPVNKGDLIPDTKDKHYPEGLTHNDLNKTVTREVTITDPTGKKSTTTQTVTFTRGATVDEVTNEVTYDDWSENGKHTFDKVDVPNVPGYTASGEVPSIAVTPETQSSKVDITYTANTQAATITYIDDTTKTNLDSKEANGKFGQAITFGTAPTDEITNYEKQGYKLVSNNFKPGIKYQNDNKFNIFEVHLVHTYEPVETSQTITETIHYIDVNGKPVAPDYVAKAVIEMTGTRDKVTNSITWNTPSTGHFDEVISPEVPNMTPDKKFIPSRNVQYGDSDITENVVYTSDETSREPEKPNDQGKPNSKTPEKPNKSGNPTSKTSEKSNKSSKEVSKQFGTIAKTTIPEKPIDSRTVDNHVSAKTTTKRELPQTGTTANTGIWTGLVSIITSLGLLGASKKCKKN